jgi:uncharacterized UPF0160 family protein
MVVVTHSGKFHADDAWAVAVLNILYPDCEIVRTRDPATIEAADFAIDVGGIWDAGLVWREYGARCVAALAREHTGRELSEDTAQQLAYAIDTDIVQYLDLSDVGAAKNAPGGYGLSAIVSGYNPNWMDEQRMGYGEATEAYRLAQFRNAMALLTDIMVNSVKYRVGALLALEQVRGSEVLENGRVLFLKNGALPWSTVVRKEMPKVLFVISHSIAEQRYMIHTVPVSAESFDARADLPEPWAGLRDADLASVTGVADATFCHNGRFIAAAKSFEGIRELARQALRAVDEAPAEQ